MQASEKVWAEAEAWVGSVEAEAAAEEEEWLQLALGINTAVKQGVDYFDLHEAEPDDQGHFQRQEQEYLLSLPRAHAAPYSPGASPVLSGLSGPTPGSVGGGHSIWGGNACRRGFEPVTVRGLS